MLRSAEIFAIITTIFKGDVLRGSALFRLEMLTRVARCPVLNRTVRYFGSLFGIKMIVIGLPVNACANSSIFCATNMSTTNVRYF